MHPHPAAIFPHQKRHLKTNAPSKPIKKSHHRPTRKERNKTAAKHTRKCTTAITKKTGKRAPPRRKSKKHIQKPEQVKD